MVDRPDFSKLYDSSGNALAESTPTSHQELVTAIKNDPGPAQMPASVPADQSAPVPARRGFSGLPDWDKPRNESGQFITKSEGELRQQWSKEGGYAVNAARVMQVEQTILSMSADPAALQTAISELPRDIALKAADILRLGAGYKDGGAGKWLQFEDSLSPSELATFKAWWRKLPQGDRDAIELAVSR